MCVGVSQLGMIYDKWLKYELTLYFDEYIPRYSRHGIDEKATQVRKTTTRL